MALSAWIIFWRRKSSHSIYPHSFHSQLSSFLPLASCFHLCQFPVAWRISFSIPHSVDLWAVNSLGFCVSENVLISLYFLKKIFTSYRILGWQWFPSSTCKAVRSSIAFCFPMFLVRRQLSLLLPLPCT